MSDNSDENYEESRIQELMKKYNCTRENAEKRRASSRVAFAVLSPNLFKPIPQPQQVEEPIEEEQVEESIEEPEEMEETETIEDPFFEKKQSQLAQKQRILNKLENQLDREQLEDEAFQAFLAVPQWRELLLDYVKSIQMLLDGWADYYIYTCQRVGDKINREYEFYKDRKQVTIDTTFHTSTGTKTVAELIAEAEKKRQEKLDQFRHKGVATVEKAEVT